MNHGRFHIGYTMALACSTGKRDPRAHLFETGFQLASRSLTAATQRVAIRSKRN